jgi:farnesyl-diphosphate farnesyltransferase
MKPVSQDFFPLLREVSRSFYWTLRVLPGRIRTQIGLAYLLARATDTIADTELVSLEERLAVLDSFRARIQGTANGKLGLVSLAHRQGSPAERVLLEKCEEAIELLARLGADDRRRVQEVLAIITSGQQLDLKRFARASADNIIALRNDGELDDYTYRVAGCVGEFWTRMCRAHLFPDAPLDVAGLLKDGVRFGKGLQLVNILRDLPADLRQGRCYLPQEGLAAVGLKPAELLEPSNEPRMRPLYDEWLARASAHLRAGWSYTNHLPWTCARVRLACAWPLLIGRETLELLRTGRVLDVTHRLKITRGQVRGLVWRSIRYYPLPPAWRSLFRD